MALVSTPAFRLWTLGALALAGLVFACLGYVMAMTFDVGNPAQDRHRSTAAVLYLALAIVSVVVLAATGIALKRGARRP